MRPCSAINSSRALGACATGIAFAIAGLLAHGVAIAKIVVMHGYAELTSATLWIQTEAPGPVTVTWRPTGETADRHVALVATAETDNVVVARLTGLEAGDGTAYRVEAGTERRAGMIRPQPRRMEATAAPTFKFAIGSCFFLGDADPRWGGADYGGGYEIFAAIAAKAPDVMLWLGDNVYLQRPDFHAPAAMAARYRRQRSLDTLQGLLTATTHLAIWDDHDYGPNDSDATYAFKDVTLQLFQRYWPNPNFGLPGVPGTFGVARYGDVSFFLLDDRYHRSPNGWPDGPDKTMFGARQLEWLKQALLDAPRGNLKIVANGSQLWSREHRFEGWHHYATERNAFADWLLAQKIDGLIFLSGDRHFSEVLRVPRPRAYPIHEFTSSPLTSRPPARIDRRERTNPDVVPGTLVVQRQFGLIRVSGPEGDRRVALESYDSGGALLWRHEIASGDLRFPRP